MKPIVTFIFITTLCLCTSFAKPRNSDATAQYKVLVDQYFDFYFQQHPTEATAQGLHQHDKQLEDYSAAGRAVQIRGLKEFLGRFQAFDRTGLTADDAADLDFVISSIQSALLELEDIQSWRKDPDTYTSGVTNSIFLIMKRNYAPAEERLAAVVARERQIPKAFDEARRNLKNPPKIYTQIALEQLPDVADFFRKDVPEAFSSVKDPKLLADFKAANQGVIAALEGYEKYLKESVLPHANGDFRLGPENYRKKLLYDEMVDIPLDRLLEIGYADLRRNQEQMKKVAAQISPGASVEQVLEQVQKQHPAPNQLLQAFQNSLAGIREFIEQKKLLTIPPGAPPVIEETPPFERATTEASLDTPGAYETKDKKALFNVTTPDPKWTPERTEGWMKMFNNAIIPNTSVHEVYPGHFVQFLWIINNPSKVRKLIFCSSNAEGWAHYAEQMMLDEGYGNGDPKMRIGQLEDALLRNARYIVGIEMHTGHMTLSQAKQFFIKEGYQPESVADVEMKRGTSDPTYLVYTLGKLQILKLRADYEKMRGKDFSLREFHDKFLAQGGVPLKIIRKAMLGNDSPTL
jgi:uncharacterized protein (DUF885 family)